jgi:hypothetical protein
MPVKQLIPFAALAAVGLAAASPAAAQGRGPAAQDEERRFDAAQERFDREYEQFQQALDRYRRFRASNWQGPPPRQDYYDNRDEQFYDPARDYRDGPNYRERVLTQDDRVYRGQDGRYYCKRSDGTTGLIVGAAAGGLFGNVIAGGGSRTVGTLLGAIAGGALGSAADRNSNREIRCR